MSRRVLAIVMLAAGCADEAPGLEHGTQSATIQRQLSKADAEYPGKAMFDGTTSGTVTLGANVGYKFAPLLDGHVTGLGGLFSGRYNVRLFDASTGAVLATASHLGTSAFATTAIEPIPVYAGYEYVVAVEVSSTGAREETAGRARKRNHVEIRCLVSRSMTTSAGSGTGSGSASATIMPPCLPATATMMQGLAEIEFVPSMLSDCAVVPALSDATRCADWQTVTLGAGMEDGLSPENIGRTRWVQGDFVLPGKTTAIVDDVGYEYATPTKVDYFIGDPWHPGASGEPGRVDDPGFETTVRDPDGSIRKVKYGFSLAAGAMPVWTAGPKTTFMTKRLSNLVGDDDNQGNYVPYYGRAGLATTCVCSQGQWVVGAKSWPTVDVGRCAKQSCATGAETWERNYFDYQPNCNPGPVEAVPEIRGYAGETAITAQDYSVTAVLETVKIECEPPTYSTGPTGPDLGTCVVPGQPVGNYYEFCRVTRPNGARVNYCQPNPSASSKSVCERYCQYTHGDFGPFWSGDPAWERVQNLPCDHPEAPAGAAGLRCTPK